MAPHRAGGVAALKLQRLDRQVGEPTFGRACPRLRTRGRPRGSNRSSEVARLDARRDRRTVAAAGWRTETDRDISDRSSADARMLSSGGPTSESRRRGRCGEDSATREGRPRSRPRWGGAAAAARADRRSPRAGPAAPAGRGRRRRDPPEARPGSDHGSAAAAASRTQRFRPSRVAEHLPGGVTREHHLVVRRAAQSAVRSAARPRRAAEDAEFRSGGRGRCRWSRHRSRRTASCADASNVAQDDDREIEASGS